MHFIIILILIFLGWRVFKMLFAYANRREDEKNLWRLLFLAFIGAILRKLIERKPPKDDFDGNAYKPFTPRGPAPPDYGFDDLFQKAIESVRRERTRVG